MARAAEIDGPVLIDVVSDIDAVAPKGSAPLAAPELTTVAPDREGHP